MEKIKAAAPLALQNAYNVRDIGCYYDRNGRKLQEKRFLRSDALNRLTEKEWLSLKEYGVAAVIDLRSPMERYMAPFTIDDASFTAKSPADSIAYHSLPLFDNIQSNDGTQKAPKSLHELYCGLLENSSAQITRVFQCFLQYPKGCCLFNCSAGKDRTGVIAMLLLGLADVDEETIIADYSASADNMEPVFSAQISAMEQAGYGAMAFLLQSEPEQMRLTLEYIREKYGSIPQYLQKLLSGKELEALRHRLTL